jgi:alkylated DNA repair dioxygenase AlkB
VFTPRLPLAITPEQAMQRLREETAWRAEHIQVWGKLHLQPRLMAWHGDASYRYSGKTFHPLPFTPLQRQLKQAVEQATGRQFNSVLLNYYRNERDSMGFHADDEPELGPQPAIASLSFGARRAILKHRHNGQTLKLDLGDGAAADGR